MSTEISRVRNFVNDKNSAVPITASFMDSEFDQIMTGLNRKMLVKSTAPSSPIEGSTWYDSTNKMVKVYRNSAWDRVDVPAGVILPYGAASAPTGWLLCDGTAVSRTTYADLFAIVSTTFGTGDGSTTFNLPDMRGKFPLGKAASGTGSSLGGTGGSIDHTHTGPSHTHTGPSHTHTATTSAANAATGGGGSGANNTEQAHTHTLTTSASGTGNTGSSGTGDTGTANPPFVALNYIIKY